MRTIAVIPALNEEKSIGPVIEKARLFVDEIIVIDDGSADGTAEAAKRAGALALRHALNRGQGAALKTGTEAALLRGADIIVHLDADGQHDPSFIPSLIEPLARGEADVVLGSRFMGVKPVGMPWKRRILQRCIRWFNLFMLGIPRQLTDPQSGLRALSAKAARRLDFRQDRYAHCSELLRLITRSDLRWKEIPIEVRYTQESLAKGQKNLDAVKVAWQLFLGVFHK